MACGVNSVSKSARYVTLGTEERIPVMAITFSCATIHFPTVYNLQHHQKFLSYHAYMVVCLLWLYVLAMSKVISGWVPTCDSWHSWRLYSAAPLGNQAASTSWGLVGVLFKYAVFA